MVELIQEALPFVCDVSGEDMHDGEGRNIPRIAYNCIRLQHLLDRMEQVI